MNKLKKRCLDFFQKRRNKIIAKKREIKRITKLTSPHISEDGLNYINKFSERLEFMEMVICNYRKDMNSNDEHSGGRLEVSYERIIGTCREILESHGFTVQMESQEENKQDTEE